MSVDILLNQDIDVNFEDFFSGPFDLLLHLVKKHELDLTEINLSVLTSKYLEILKTIHSYNIDIASDFLLIAAILINLKSQSIFYGVPEELNDENTVSSEHDLFRRLLRYRKYSLASEWLKQNIKIQNGIWRRLEPSKEEFISNDLKPPKPSELTKIARNFENRIQNKRLHGFYKPLNIPIKRKMTEILEVFSTNSNLTLDKLFDLTQCRSLVEYVVSFIAVLELAKINLLTIHQHFIKGEIYLSTEHNND